LYIIYITLKIDLIYLLSYDNHCNYVDNATTITMLLLNKNNNR